MKEVDIMTLSQFIRGLKRLTTIVSIIAFLWLVAILAVVGAFHIIDDHKLFGWLG